MKKTTVIFIFLALFVRYNAQTFVKEGKETEVPQKYKWINYLGIINGNAYYYDYKKNKSAETTFQFYRLGQTDLTPEAPTEIDLNLTKRVGTYTADKVYLKSNRIYILYSLLDSKAEPPGITSYIKILDENLKEISTLKINHEVISGFNYLGDFDIIFSPNGKKALLALNHISKKYIYNMEKNSGKKTQIIWMDLDKNVEENSLFFEKDNPELRRFYENFSITDNGNIAFTIEEYKSDLRDALISINIGLVKYKTTNILGHNVKLNDQDFNLHHKIYTSNNGKTTYMAITNNRFIYTSINLLESKIETETSHLIKNWKIPTEYNSKSMMLGILSENDKDICITIEHITEEVEDPNNPKIKIKKNYLGILKINSNGDFVWAKTIPRNVSQYHKFPVYYYNSIQNVEREKDYSIFCAENNISIITREEITSDKENYKTGFPSNIACYKINPNGNMNKSIIYTNTKESGIIPSSSALMFENGHVLFNIISPNKIKFTTLKL